MAKIYYNQLQKLLIETLKKRRAEEANRIDKILETSEMLDLSKVKIIADVLKARADNLDCDISLLKHFGVYTVISHA